MEPRAVDALWVDWFHHLPPACSGPPTPVLPRKHGGSGGARARTRSSARTAHRANCAGRDDGRQQIPPPTFSTTLSPSRQAAAAGRLASIGGGSCKSATCRPPTTTSRSRQAAAAGCFSASGGGGSRSPRLTSSTTLFRSIQAAAAGRRTAGGGSGSTSPHPRSPTTKSRSRQAAAAGCLSAGGVVPLVFWFSGRAAPACDNGPACPLTCKRSLHSRSGGPLTTRCVHWHVSGTVWCRLLTGLSLSQSRRPRLNRVLPRSLTILRTALPPAAHPSPHASPHAQPCPHLDATEGLHLDRAWRAPPT